MLGEETLLSLCELKKKLRGASLEAVIREARTKKIIDGECKVSRATLYRLFKQRGLMIRSHLLSHATASLGIALIHCQTLSTPGKGKDRAILRRQCACSFSAYVPRA